MNDLEPDLDMQPRRALQLDFLGVIGIIEQHAMSVCPRQDLQILEIH